MAKATKAPGVKSNLPPGFKQVKAVTLPALVLQLNEPRILQFDAAIRQSTITADPKKQREKPADIAPVTDLETGEQFTLLVPSIVKSELSEKYPKDTYVGKAFRIVKLEKRKGKRYHDMNINEVAIEK